MANTNIPNFLINALEAEGVKPEAVLATRPEEVFSCLVQGKDGVYALTFMKVHHQGSEPQWVKIGPDRTSA